MSACGKLLWSKFQSFESQSFKVAKWQGDNVTRSYFAFSKWFFTSLL